MPVGELGDVFAGVGSQVPNGLAEHLRGIALIDHHVHGNFDKPVDRATFEASINEGSTDPVPAFMSQFDSPLGLSIRRWCAPLLGLDALASPDEYWARRSEFSPDELAEAMLPAAKVSRWIVDSGFKGDLITTHGRLAELSGGRSSEIVRLERLAEDLLENGTRPDDFPDALRSTLAEAADSPDVVGTKTIVAYRTGFDIDWTRPDDAVVVAHARELSERPGPLRVDSPVLIAFAVHEAAAHGLPIQVHVGFGDRDLDLHRTDRDPAWPALAVQLGARPRRRIYSDTALCLATAGVAVGQALAYLDRGHPATLGASLEWQLPDWRLRRRSWRAHFDCDCGAATAKAPDPADTAE